MAKIKIDRIKIPRNLPTGMKLEYLEKHILHLEQQLEYILANLSDDNFKKR